MNMKTEKNNVFEKIIMFKNNIWYIINRLCLINYIVDNIINCMINSISILRDVFSQ